MVVERRMIEEDDVDVRSMAEKMLKFTPYGVNVGPSGYAWLAPSPKMSEAQWSAEFRSGSMLSSFTVDCGFDLTRLNVAATSNLFSACLPGRHGKEEDRNEYEAENGGI